MGATIFFLLWAKAVSCAAFSGGIVCPGRAVLEEEKKNGVGYLSLGQSFCTGTLLSPHVVITAAHCVEKITASAVSFTLNADLGAARRGPFAKAVEIRRHPQFSRGSGDKYGGADIALLRLGDKNYGKEPLAFLAPLEGAPDLVAGTTAYLVGYGLNQDSPSGVRRSRHIRFQTREPAHLAGGVSLGDAVLKFGRGDEGELPCGGDSGSPVLKYVGQSTGILAIHSASAAMNSRYRDGSWSKNTPQHACRSSFETYTTALGPFTAWIEQNRAAMETDAAACR